ncbi:saccharopine dehydrogenase NADP-binding domain-containing protein [Nocardia sp. NPDC004860]|uniref:saccharopine dehydrogenase NADP-binding domain-containing protein n=1 Tax=Nocardia sp. NPDC004860 TaxID=3154557 RepID=UPI0033A484F6
MAEIWIIGATGRAGRNISAELRAGGHRIVLVGRNTQRLAEAAATIEASGGVSPRTLVTDDPLAEIAAGRPDVVVNTVGPFGATTVPTAQACVAAGSHYVDLANEFQPVRSLLELDSAARAAGSTLVTGAGFGTLANEALVYELCAGRPSPIRVRVAAMPVVDGLGPAVLASVVDAAATGGLIYRDGRLVRTRLGAHLQRIPLPDGTTRATVAVPTGELEAALRGSGAGDVIATSSEVPTGRVARAALPIVGAILRVEALRRTVIRLIDRWQLTPPATPGEVSWAYASAEWEGGGTRQAWLRTGEGYAFTSRVAAMVASRLAEGAARPGAFTPGALFGADLARSAGATITLDSTAKDLR